MSRCCLTVGLLGLLAPSFHPLAAAEVRRSTILVIDRLKTYPTWSRSQRRAAGATGRAAGDAGSQFRRRPQGHRRSRQGQGRPQRLPGLSAGLVVPSRRSSTDQAIAALEKFEKDFPQSTMVAPRPLCQGPGDGRQGRLPRRPGDLRTRGQVSALRIAGGSNRRPSTWSSPTPGSSPADPIRQPDYKSAREFYTLALDTGLAAQQRAEVEFRIGYCLQKLGVPAEAATAYEKFLAAHADDPRQMEARYRMGECLLAAGRLPEARKAWRELLKTAGGREQGAGSKPVTPVREAGGLKCRPLHDWPAEAAFHLARDVALSQPGQRR